MPNRAQFKTKEEYNAYFARYREEHRESWRNYRREYNKIWRKENGYHNEKASQLRYPEKVKAREILNKAVREGKIIRGCCIVCKKPKAQGHHENYKKPLEVIWLCALHHSQTRKRGTWLTRLILKLSTLTY